MPGFEEEPRRLGQSRAQPSGAGAAAGPAALPRAFCRCACQFAWWAPEPGGARPRPLSKLLHRPGTQNKLETSKQTKQQQQKKPGKEIPAILETLLFKPAVLKSN